MITTDPSEVIELSKKSRLEAVGLANRICGRSSFEPGKGAAVGGKEERRRDEEAEYYKCHHQREPARVLKRMVPDPSEPFGVQ